ncbi:hypothetical protein TanjilG_17582 [Lupinus angustifolius]|uniref:DUF4408 domain-containing protein n=1 Tax=Lupinus angustifolius TaxID=3871 RepID=A0A1J7GAK8_LUPAN|nr:PREDICTED: uncharacterized protein LOC109327862 [Lupinus angustifolius]OIV97398.1 hypothetical protein TanjilG_17582 [Lupinus angustifolius]
MVEAETTASIYALISNWFTPSCLFIFINLVIGTIFIIKSRVDSPQLTPETETQNPVHDKHEPEPVEGSQERLNRGPSLLERVMSVKLFRLQSIEGEVVHHGGEELEGVDEKADNFIKRFKEQLRLQRLDSILRYRDMMKGN